MFGYLVAAAGVLEDDRRQRYQQLYCGLCRSLERCFGHPARLTLNYDMTFLVLLLGSLYEPEEETAQRRCPRHPLEAQTYVCSEISDYAANMNLALAYLKCLDDWRDDRSLSALAEAKTLEPWYHTIQARYPRQCQAITRALDALGEIEKSGEEAPDAAAACFGDLMAEVFVYREDRWSPALRNMGHALGRFLYLLDAAMDLEDDVKTGSYNAFRSLAGQDNEQRFRDILKMQLGECLFWFDKLPLIRDEQLLQNILCVGLWLAFNQKFGGKDA